jgi:hypothetical protein
MRLLRAFVMAAFLALGTSAVAAEPVVGTWEYKEPISGFVLSMTLNSDGTGLMDGEPIRYTLKANTLTVVEDGEAIAYTVRVTGDQLHASGGDLDAPLTFTRRGGAGAAQPIAQPPASQPARAQQAGGVVGTWNSSEGPVVLNADGSGSLNGVAFRYRVEGATIVLVGAEGEAQVPFRLDADRMDVFVDGAWSTMTRAGAGGAVQADATGLAGVYVATESSVDPGIFMSYTQYVILYPDGTVSYAKAEGGATRAQVSESIERFTSFQTRPELKGQTHGTWQAQGNAIVIRWNLWNNLVCRGQVDPATGKLQIEKMGVLSEGATLAFDRQK